MADKIYCSHGSAERGAREAYKHEWNPSETAIEIAREFSSRSTSRITVCDIGGAHGRDCLYLAEHGFDTILIEPNELCLETAMKKLKEIAARSGRVNFTIKKGALPHLRLQDEAADIVELRGVLMHILPEEKPVALREVYRIMRPRGRLYSSSYGDFGGELPKKGMYPVKEKDAFVKLHESAGLRLVGDVSQYRPKSNPKGSMWYARFEK